MTDTTIVARQLAVRGNPPFVTNERPRHWRRPFKLQGGSERQNIEQGERFRAELVARKARPAE
jgi:hypothetical protein